MSLLLFSTNPWLKYHIQNRFYGGVHFVWCSEQFSDTTAAPSSTPREIYSRLKADCAGRDKHSPKIIEQRSRLVKRTKSDLSTGRLNSAQGKEIYALAKDGDFSLWRPLLYIIPVNGIDPTRIIAVDPAEWAGIVPEFQIAGLHTGEFECVEF